MNFSTRWPRFLSFKSVKKYSAELAMFTKFTYDWVGIKHGYGYGWPDTDTDEGIKHG